MERVKRLIRICMYEIICWSGMEIFMRIDNFGMIFGVYF